MDLLDLVHLLLFGELLIHMSVPATACPTYDCELRYNVTETKSNGWDDEDSEWYTIAWEKNNTNESCVPAYYLVRSTQLFSIELTELRQDEEEIDISVTRVDTASYVLPFLPRSQLFQVCAIFDSSAESDVRFNASSGVYLAAHVKPVGHSIIFGGPSLGIVLGVVFSLLTVQIAALSLAYLASAGRCCRLHCLITRKIYSASYPTIDVHGRRQDANYNDTRRDSGEPLTLAV